MAMAIPTFTVNWMANLLQQLMFPPLPLVKVKCRREAVDGLAEAGGPVKSGFGCQVVHTAGNSRAAFRVRVVSQISSDGITPDMSGIEFKFTSYNVCLPLLLRFLPLASAENSAQCF